MNNNDLAHNHLHVLRQARKMVHTNYIVTRLRVKRNLSAFSRLLRVS